MFIAEVMLAVGMLAAFMHRLFRNAALMEPVALDVRGPWRILFHGQAEMPPYDWSRDLFSGVVDRPRW